MESKLPTGLTIRDMVKLAHENAKDKGWWDKEPTFGELIALCHSELSEALEEYRTNVPETKLKKKWNITKLGLIDMEEKDCNCNTEV